MPMVAVYILGHRVGDIEEPVLYVRPKAYNYDEQPVTKGLPDPFIDSLTHNSIIVQIPLLHGQINNRLDKVLSFFDQTNQDHDSQHFLKIDDNLYEGDEEMQLILRRLLMAASDVNTRQDMNVEDEYYSIIEKRDTEIMLNARKIAEQNAKLAENEKLLEEKQSQIDEKQSQIDEIQSQLDEMLRSSVLALAQTGMNDEAIAKCLATDANTVRRIIRLNAV